MDGILPHSMADALRGKSDDQLSPHEAVLRYFRFLKRITPEEHAQVTLLHGKDLVRYESPFVGLRPQVSAGRHVYQLHSDAQPGSRVTRNFPDHGDCWAMLSALYIFEYRDGFGVQPDPLGRAFAAARRAVDVAPSSHLSHWALATALFFRRELVAFRPAAERVIELNRMDGSTIAWMGYMIAFSGDWERGCAIADAASKLNPHHAGWHRFLAFYSAYRKGEYRNALDAAVRLNMPGYFNAAAALVAAFGQLGDREASQRAVKELLDLRPDYATAARKELEKYCDPELVEHLLDGLRKAGLAVA
jgi:tetratricopeptide (TPR) repeat protein